MNYVKKMCILRQIKQGFSGDGKALSGLIKVEQYGKNLAVEVSIINFAPLVSGEYYCLLSDGKGKTEMLSLRGKSIFNILSDMNITEGFCGIICYVKTEVIPIAYGINGKGSYDWRAILNATLPPVFPNGVNRKTGNELAFDKETEHTLYEATTSSAATNSQEATKTNYDDDEVATENYFEEVQRECIQPAKTNEDARAQGTAENKTAEKGTNAPSDGDASGVLQPHEKPTNGYYLSIKRELDELFSRYPQDATLCGAFSHSEWVRIKGSAKDPHYLVGAVYESGKVKYVCYALLAEDKNNPPEEIKEVCAFVPVSPLHDAKGFFVIFQSASSGECIHPGKV